jgi:hypothetical protein
MIPNRCAEKHSIPKCSEPFLQRVLCYVLYGVQEAKRDASPTTPNGERRSPRLLFCVETERWFGKSDSGDSGLNIGRARRERADSNKTKTPQYFVYLCKL